MENWKKCKESQARKSDVSRAREKNFISAECDFDEKAAILQLYYE
jgi:hypothetical protein